MHYQLKNPNLGGSQETLKTVVLVIQEQPRFKKRVQTQGRSSAPKVMFMKGGGSQNGKPTCATFGKKNYEECLVGTSICFGCGKDGHKVRDCLLLEKKRIRKLILMFQKKMLQQGGISTLRTREEKPDKSDDDLGTYLSLNCCDMSSF